ncbi:hypothetical protein [Bacillus cereus]|uniref:hypothetical protein n=1 Tax=Bacillus cereus TaxID=1396 RepID=UPI003012A42B
MNHSIVDAMNRKEKMKEEGKVDLPLAIDTKKYLIWKIAWRDVFITLPFAIFGGLVVGTLYMLGEYKLDYAILAFSPMCFVLTFLLIPHPVRKNLSFLEYRVIWKAQYKWRKKQFFYTKGEGQMAQKWWQKLIWWRKQKEQDIREVLGIRNIYNDCYETMEDTLVKVIEVSSVNLSLLHAEDKKRIYGSYETFLNEKPREIDIQIARISQPVNLKSYYNRYKEKFDGDVTADHAKRYMQKGYLQHIEQIQKSKNMVTQKRYIVISKKFSEGSKEKVLQELKNQADVMRQLVENMLTGYYKLSAQTLNNDELFRLMYTCIDYENAQVNTSFQASAFPMSIGEQTKREERERWEADMQYKIT